MILPYIQCPILASVKVDMVEDEARDVNHPLAFLMRRTTFIATLDLPYIIHAAEPAQKKPVAFPALASMSESFKTRHSSLILRTIQGISLAEIHISVYASIPLDALVGFFTAASDTVANVTVLYGHGPNPCPSLENEAVPMKSIFTFSGLGSFTSGCRLVHVLISLTKSAPVLKFLQLHGALIDNDYPTSEIMDSFVCIFVLTKPLRANDLCG